MRIFILALALVAGCGGKGQLTIISCGTSTCDVSNGNVCCVSTSAAMCTNTNNCAGGNAQFNCLGASTCPGGVCCVNDLGAVCAKSCAAGQKPACDTNADCEGSSCNTRFYNSASGAPLFAISICGGP